MSKVFHFLDIRFGHVIYSDNSKSTLINDFSEYYYDDYDKKYSQPRRRKFVKKPHYESSIGERVVQ